MPASPRIQTLGEPVWALDCEPGAILMLDEKLIPTWVNPVEHVDPGSATPADVVNALIALGLMKAA